MMRQHLIRRQTASKISKLKPLRSVATPNGGWIRAIRSALGLTAGQLARRVGIKRQAITRLERAELTGSVRIETMRRVAEGLDCVFVYAMIPKTSLERTVTDQARKVAMSQLARTSHTMELEDQGLDADAQQSMLDFMVSEIVRNPPRNLWDA